MKDECMIILSMTRKTKTYISFHLISRDINSRVASGDPSFDDRQSLPSGPKYLISRPDGEAELK